MVQAPVAAEAIDRRSRSARSEHRARAERHPHAGILALQRSAGNAAVAALVSVQRCGDRPCDCGGCGGEHEEAQAPRAEVQRAPAAADPPKTKPTADDLADQETSETAAPAADMGKALNDILAWRASGDDAGMVSRLADVVSFPAEYKRIVTGIAVGLLPALPDQSPREALLAHVAQGLDDLSQALDTVKSPGAVNLGLPQLSEARAKKISDRIAALKAIATAPSSVGISGKRLAAVSLAAGEVGKVDHRMVEGGKRLGGDRLLDYFRVAFGGTVPPNVEATITRPPKNANILKECTPTTPQPCDPLPPWCGIFASWAYQSGGIALPPWTNDGQGINQRGAWRMLTKKDNDEIRPGDLATRTSGNHQAIVIAVTPEGIETAEGNTNEGGGTGFDAAVGGKIVHKTYAGQGLGIKGWDTGFWRPPGAD